MNDLTFSVMWTRKTSIANMVTAIAMLLAVRLFSVMFANGLSAPQPSTVLSCFFRTPPPFEVWAEWSKLDVSGPPLESHLLSALSVLEVS